MGTAHLIPGVGEHHLDTSSNQHKAPAKSIRRNYELGSSPDFWMQ